MPNIEEELKKRLEELGFNLYSIEQVQENGENIYRVNFFHKDESLSLDDCAQVHKQLYPYLEEAGISDEYTVQIGSVGVEKPLTQKWHYELAIGEQITLKTNGKDKKVGVLKEVKGDEIVLQDKNNQTHSISLSDIKKAKTLFSFS